MTETDALTCAFERAAGYCECIGGGCPALTHLPGVNRCTAPLAAAETTAFFVVGMFVDRSDPENFSALCAACAGSQRRRGKRVAWPAPATDRSGAPSS